MLTEINEIYVHNPFHKNKTNTYLSAAIRKACGSYWNHAAMCINIYGQYYIIQAEFPYSTMTKYEDWLIKEPDRIIEIHNLDNDFNINDVKQRSLQLVGVPYDLLSLCIFLPELLIKRKWKGLEGEEAKKSVYCFELCEIAKGNKNSFDVLPPK